MKCNDILKHCSPDDVVKLPSEIAQNIDHKNGWQIQSNCMKKVSRGHASRYEKVIIAEDN